MTLSRKHLSSLASLTAAGLSFLATACGPHAPAAAPAVTPSPTPAPTAPASVSAAASRAAWTGPASAPTIASTPLAMPGASAGTNFDDFQFDPASGKLLIPGGQSGNLDIVDPATHAVTSISGFGTQPTANGHHGGTTSASAGAGLWFATDRTAKTVSIIDPKKGVVLSSVALAGGPDYVRYIAPTNEVWVTEPHDGGVIEVFKLKTGAKPTLTSTGTFPIPDAPESLVVDATRGRVYTNDEPKQKTEAIDLKTHAIVATWPNACTGEASGLVLDEARGFAVIGCGEGAASVIDVGHDGAKLGYLRIVTKTDIIAYDPTLNHVYLPGAASGTMAILGLSPKGDLSILGIAAAAEGSKCVVVDDRHTAYVCDPKHGQLLLVADPYPATK